MLSPILRLIRLQMLLRGVPIPSCTGTCASRQEAALFCVSRPEEPGASDHRRAAGFAAHSLVFPRAPASRTQARKLQITSNRSTANTNTNTDTNALTKTKTATDTDTNANPNTNTTAMAHTNTNASTITTANTHATATTSANADANAHSKTNATANAAANANANANGSNKETTKANASKNANANANLLAFQRVLPLIACCLSLCVAPRQHRPARADSQPLAVLSQAPCSVGAIATIRRRTAPLPSHSSTTAILAIWQSFVFALCQTLLAPEPPSSALGPA